MKLQGRRVHIAGSAKLDAQLPALTYAHDLIERVTERLALAGAGFVIQLGKEPRAADNPVNPSITFDWTVAETLGRLLHSGRIQATTSDGPLIACVTTDKTSTQVPADRVPLWDRLIASGAMLMRHVEPGWTAGAIRRQIQSRLGDMLIALSGGEGVEHLATEYALLSKPVIPLDLQIGSSCDDGSGGAAMLAGRMRAHPERFIRLVEASRAGNLLMQMETRQGQRAAETVADAMLALLDALAPPTAFFVRLLNRALPEFNDVETFFREVVDPTIRSHGYDPIEMGLVESSNPFINAEIFERILHAPLSIVDLTGVRTNCFMELGYAFGLGKRVLITAQEGTQLPFDSSAIDTRMWNLARSRPELISDLEDYWRRNINRPPLAVARNLT
jgi:hypothetical protein